MAPLQKKSSAPDDAVLSELLAKARLVTIVGAKDTPGKAVNNVGRYLINAGYSVLPVHPKRRSVWGLYTLPRLEDVPASDIVVLFRASQYCAEHAREALRMRVRPACFWMQEGIASPEARQILEAEGIMVVEDRCIAVEHKRLLGAKAGQ